MGHTPGFPCVDEDPQHEGRCQSIVLDATPVNLDATRYFEVTETRGLLTYWRTNATAVVGNQVEFRAAGGSWRTSLVFGTEVQFVKSVQPWAWREITEAEVPS